VLSSQDNENVKRFTWLSKCAGASTIPSERGIFAVDVDDGDDDDDDSRMNISEGG